MKWRASTRTSSSRQRSGGRMTGTTCSRCTSSARSGPDSADASSVLHATSRQSPRGCSRAASSRSCAGSGSASTSCSARVPSVSPDSAASSRPAAPAARQATATRLRAARGPSRCTARTASRAPLPGSPSSSSGALLAAAARSDLSASRIACEAPSRPCSPAPAISPATRWMRCSSSTRCRALRIDCMSRSRVTGFSMKSTAPACVASTARPTEPKAVMTTIALCGACRRMESNSVSPCASGSCMSSRITSGRW